MEVPSWNHFSHTFLGEQKSEAEVRQWSWQSLVATRLPKSKPKYFFTQVACQLHLHGCRRQARRSQKMVENIPESPKKNPKVCSRWGYTYLQTQGVWKPREKETHSSHSLVFSLPKTHRSCPPAFFCWQQKSDHLSNFHLNSKPRKYTPESLPQRHQMDVSENSGTPKSSILMGFSIMNHPFWGTLFLETPKFLGYGRGAGFFLLRFWCSQKWQLDQIPSIKRKR